MTVVVDSKGSLIVAQNLVVGRGRKLVRAHVRRGNVWQQILRRSRPCAWRDDIAIRKNALTLSQGRNWNHTRVYSLRFSSPLIIREEERPVPSHGAAECSAKLVLVK